MIDLRILLRLLPLLLLAAAPARAQTGETAVGGEAADEAQAPPRYTVEVIVFAYAEDVGVGTERFEPEPYSRPAQPADAEPTVADDDNPPPNAPQPMPEEPAPRFVMLPLDDDAFGMRNIYDMLERLDVYEPLMHVGWTQTAIPREYTPELRLERLGPVPPGLDGTLELYLGRFVHLVVDVSLDAQTTAAGDDRQAFQPFEAPPDEFGGYRDEARRASDSLDLLYKPLRYRISEDRIMKSGETRYYDHPRFGVIARVTLVEQDEDENAAALR